MKNRCPRCDSSMESKGFRVMSGGIKKRRYRCLTCRYQQYEGQIPTKLNDIKDLSVVVKGGNQDVSYDEETKSDYFQILSSFSNARSSFFDITVEEELSSSKSKEFFTNCDCDCDSVFFNFLGCVIHVPKEFHHDAVVLDGSFCELYPAYFSR